MSSPQGECRLQEVGDFEFLFVLFVGDLLILLGRGYSYGLGEVVERATAK